MKAVAVFCAFLAAANAAAVIHDSSLIIPRERLDLVLEPRANKTGEKGDAKPEGEKGDAKPDGGNGKFGKCDPTMTFEKGRPGRKPDQGTFFVKDTKVLGKDRKADALNPAIIMNFICDQLINVCEIGGTDDPAKTAGKKAQADCNKVKDEVIALGTKDQSTADAFNKGLGV